MKADLIVEKHVFVNVSEWMAQAMAEASLDDYGIGYAAERISEQIAAMQADIELNSPDDDYRYIEVMEYWLVSDWLANQLENHDEVIYRGGMLNVWGRQTTGQAIAMDGVMEDIAARLGS